jgi:hypothetical protein
LNVERFAKQETRHQGTVGKLLKIPIKIDREFTAAKISLKASPKGVELADGSIVWTPMRDQVGNAALTVELLSESGSVLDSLHLTVEVNLPQIRLGFNVKSATFSPNGRFLAVVGGQVGDLTFPPNNIVVIDVETAKVIGRQVVPGGIDAAAIDDQFVYLSTASKKSLFRTKHDFSNLQATPVDAPPIYLSCVIDGNLIVAMGDDVTYKLIVVETGKLDTIAKLSSQSQRHEAPGTTLNVGVLNDKIVRVGNVLFDRSAGTRLAITQSAGLRSILTDSNLKNWAAGIEKGIWGFGNVREAEIVRKSYAIAEGGQTSAILNSYPMAVLVDNQKSVERGLAASGGPIFVSKTTLTYVDLGNGNKLDEFVVSHVQGTESENRRAEDFFLLWDHPKFRNVPAMSSDRIVLASGGGRVMLLNHPGRAKENESLPLPQLFVPDSLIVPVEQKLSIQINCVMDSECTLQLAGFLPGFDLTKQHRLEIDMPKLWKAWIDKAAKERQLANEVVDLSPKVSFEKNEALFRSLVGREMPIDKMALQVEVPLVIRNQERVLTRLNFSMIALGPRIALLQAMGQK